MSVCSVDSVAFRYSIQEYYSGSYGSLVYNFLRNLHSDFIVAA